jgi:nucleoside-diphosphate-sugar epimerase
MSAYEVFHFRGHWFERGVEMAERVCRVSGVSNSRIKPFPWWAIKLAAPFVNALREMLEMRYLWQVPLQLDNTKMCAVIGQEPHTPIDHALAATLGTSSRAVGLESSMAA